MNRNGAMAKRLAQTYPIEPGKDLTRIDLHVVAFKMAMCKDEEMNGTLLDFVRWLDKRGFFRDDLHVDLENQVDTFMEMRKGGEE